MKLNELKEQFDDDDNRGVKVIDRPELKTKRPKTYVCVLHNDDYTHAHRVVEILREYFNQGEQAAMTIMLKAHKQGKSPCGGPYTKDVAETKANAAMDVARTEQFPLLISVEEVAAD